MMSSEVMTGNVSCDLIPFCIQLPGMFVSITFITLGLKSLGTPLCIQRLLKATSSQ